MLGDDERKNDPSDPSPVNLVRSLLDPDSVVIIGASDSPRKASGRTLAYLKRYAYRGDVYVVNPTRRVVQGVTSYARVADLPVSPDVAIIVLPAPAVAGAIRESGRKGIRTAIVFASGFAEAGPDGVRAQEELTLVAAAEGVRVLGPNCVGTVGAPRGFTAAFMSGLDQDRFELKDDGIAFVTQSGAMGAFILSMAQSSGLGLGRFVSTGNEADITFEEILAGLVDDPTVRVILGYVEGIRDASILREALGRAKRRGIPVGLMKVGRSTRGAQAAQSHTGALVGSDGAYEGLFAQYGVFRADTIDALLDFGRVFASPRWPTGDRLSIVTLSGGAGVLMTDAADDLALSVEPWDPEWSSRVAEVLPEFASVANPIDMTGALTTDLGLLRATTDICLAHPGTDVVVVLLGNLDREEDALVDALVAAGRTSPKPLIVVWVGGSGRPIERLSRAGVPTFTEPMRAMRAVSALVTAATGRDPGERKDAQRARDEAAQVAGGSPAAQVLDEVAAKVLLASYGIATVAERACADPDAAAAAADGMRYPVVVKLLSEEVPHKSDLGFVRLAVQDAREVRSVADDVQARARALGITDVRIVVQEMVKVQTELILGMKIDPTFGPLIALGVGGVLTEVADDVQVRLPPLQGEDVVSMVRSLRYRQLLEGVRGRSAVDSESLRDTVLAFSRLVLERGAEFESLEINPLMVTDSGTVVAVDALAVRRTR